MFFFKFSKFMCVSALLALYLWIMYEPGAHEGQKKVSDFLKLKMWLNMDAGNKIQVLCKEKNILLTSDPSFRPQYLI